MVVGKEIDPKMIKNEPALFHVIKYCFRHLFVLNSGTDVFISFTVFLSNKPQISANERVHNIDIDRVLHAFPVLGKTFIW